MGHVKDETPEKNILNLGWLYFSPSVTADLFVSSATILSIWMLGLKDMLSTGR